MFNDYIKIPMVGNKFQDRRPNKYDTDIVIIKEDENTHDKNAVAVYSKREIESKIRYDKLGFIIKDKTKYVRDNFDNLKTHGLVRSIEKNSDGYYYYYLLLSIS